MTTEYYNTQVTNNYYGNEYPNNKIVTNDNAKIKSKSRSRSFIRNLNSSSSCDNFDHLYPPGKYPSGTSPGYAIYRINTNTTEIISVSIIGDFYDSKFKKNMLDTNTVEGLRIGQQSDDNMSTITWHLSIDKEHMMLYFEKIADHYWSMKKDLLKELEDKGKIVLDFTGYLPNSLIKIISRDKNVDTATI